MAAAAASDPLWQDVFHNVMLPRAIYHCSVAGLISTLSHCTKVNEVTEEAHHSGGDWIDSMRLVPPQFLSHLHVKVVRLGNAGRAGSNVTSGIIGA